MERDSKRKLGWIAAAAATAGAALAAGYVQKQRRLEAWRLGDVLKLRPGAVVAEIGAGSGWMTMRLAQQVRPGGQVLATEFEMGKLRGISRSVRRNGADNVVLLVGSQSGTELPPASCDAIFLRGVYHHLTHPEEMGRSLFRALRPGGRLAVADFAPRLWLAPWTPKDIPENRGGHGIRKQLVKRELGAAGFRPVREYDDWPFRFYCLVFEKPA